MVCLRSLDEEFGGAAQGSKWLMVARLRRRSLDRESAGQQWSSERLWLHRHGVGAADAGVCWEMWALGVGMNLRPRAGLVEWSWTLAVSLGWRME